MKGNIGPKLGIIFLATRDEVRLHKAPCLLHRVHMIVWIVGALGVAPPQT